MNRTKTLLLLAAASLTMLSLPGQAQTAAAPPRHARKAKLKATPPPPAASGGINTPAADFSTLEGPDDGTSSRASGSSVRPVIGEGGNIGFGTGF